MAQWHPRGPPLEQACDLFAGYHDTVRAACAPSVHATATLLMTRQLFPQLSPAGLVLFNVQRVCCLLYLLSTLSQSYCSSAVRLPPQESHTPTARDATPPQRRGQGYRSSSTPTPSEHEPYGARWVNLLTPCCYLLPYVPGLPLHTLSSSCREICINLESCLSLSLLLALPCSGHSGLPGSSHTALYAASSPFLYP